MKLNEPMPVEDSFTENTQVTKAKLAGLLSPIREPFYWTNWNSFAVWISNYMPDKVWDEITYLLPICNCVTGEVREWLSNLIPHFIVDEIPCPFWNWSSSMLVKEDSAAMGTIVYLPISLRWSHILNFGIVNQVIDLLCVPIDIS